jgi:hypothetical protein
MQLEFSNDFPTLEGEVLTQLVWAWLLCVSTSCLSPPAASPVVALNYSRFQIYTTVSLGARALV